VGCYKIVVTADPEVSRHVACRSMNRIHLHQLEVDDYDLFEKNLFGVRYGCKKLHHTK
jgi:hypothetical protein